MGVDFTWLAVDRHDRIIVAYSGTSGAWPGAAVVLEHIRGADAIEALLRRDLDLADRPASHFTHEADTPGLFVRVGGRGILRAADLSAELAAKVRGIRLDLDALETEEFDLLTRLPNDALENVDEPEDVETQLSLGQGVRRIIAVFASRSTVPGPPSVEALVERWAAAGPAWLDDAHDWARARQEAEDDEPLAFHPGLKALCAAVEPERTRTTEALAALAAALTQPAPEGTDDALRRAFAAFATAAEHEREVVVRQIAALVRASRGDLRGLVTTMEESVAAQRVRESAPPPPPASHPQSTMEDPFARNGRVRVRRS